jgi:hypothetical protein
LLSSVLWLFSVNGHSSTRFLGQESGIPPGQAEP